MTTQVVIVMGVSGCGKTTVANALALHQNWRCIDADQFHPSVNVEKMRLGIPLTDEDRWPWLEKLNAILRHSVAKNESIVLACSALKEVYRQRLVQRLESAKFVFLEGTFEVIESRMKERVHQYMPASLLKSQFATLEVPHGAINVSVDLAVAKQVAQIVARLG
jgi:gluconokinase